MESQNNTKEKTPNTELGGLIYCYDAYCGWCFGFSPVIKKIALAFQEKLSIEVLSGGMVIPEKPTHISTTANYILAAYKNVEDLSGVKFGDDYLWHLRNTDDSDWHPHSEKPAIALCIFKQIYPAMQVQFAADLQHALFVEGRDLTDDEAYRHLLEKYSINPEMFYEKLNSPEGKANANYEFALTKQLQVSGFPCVFVQTGDSKFNMVARGFTDYESLKERIDAVLKEA